MWENGQRRNLNKIRYGENTKNATCTYNPVNLIFFHLFIKIFKNIARGFHTHHFMEGRIFHAAIRWSSDANVKIGMHRRVGGRNLIYAHGARITPPSSNPNLT